MSDPVANLVASLPLDEDEEKQPALQELLAALSRKEVPVRALGRLWVLGSMPARIAAAYLCHWIRSAYASTDEKQRQLNETHLKAALKLLNGMAYLRGAMCKIGQFLATYPNVLPEQFYTVLSQLHFEAPPMHFALLREFVRRELGGDPEERFAEFETEAFAAASLGQVHRARLKTGEAVAVKIQYPNIARTIQTDFRNLLAMLTPMRLHRDWDDLRAQFDDVRQMLDWETDYTREAGFLERGRAVFREEEGIVVPKVYGEYSTGRVLTMEYLDGVHVAEYLAGRPSQAERDRYGTRIMRASFRLAHSAGLWYADSGPGNYLFLRDGRLGVVDFGCCREFSAEEWEFYKDVSRAHQAGGDTFRRTMLRAAKLDPDADVNPEVAQLFEDMGRWYCDYLLHDGAFDFGNEAFMQRGAELTLEVGRRGLFRSMPVNTWILRQLLGLRALVHRLGSRVNMKALNEEESQGILL